MKKKCASVLIILFSSMILHGEAESCLDRWGAFSRTADREALKAWMRDAARKILYKDKSGSSLRITLPASPDCTGLFVTLIRKGKVRGCFGAFNHSDGSPSEIIQSYIKGALLLNRAIPRLKGMSLMILKLFLLSLQIPSLWMT